MRKILQFAEGLGLLVDLADPIKFLKLDLSFRFGEESEYGSLYQPLIADWSIKDSELSRSCSRNCTSSALLDKRSLSPPGNEAPFDNGSKGTRAAKCEQN